MVQQFFGIVVIVAKRANAQQQPRNLEAIQFLYDRKEFFLGVS